MMVDTPGKKLHIVWILIVNEIDREDKPPSS